MKENIQNVINFIKSKSVINFAEAEAIIATLQKEEVTSEENADQKPTKKSS